MPLLRLRKLSICSVGYPTIYIGETFDSREFRAVLGGNRMTIEVGNKLICDREVEELTDVCSFDDFKVYAKQNDYLIDDRNAEYETSYKEEEEKLSEIFQGEVEVVFLNYFEPRFRKRNYQVGDIVSFSKELAEVFVEAGYAKYKEKEKNKI